MQIFFSADNAFKKNIYICSVLINDIIFPNKNNTAYEKNHPISSLFNSVSFFVFM